MPATDPTAVTRQSGVEVEPTQLRRWLQAPDAPRVLDVRTPREFDAVHIPGATNVPLDLVREHRRELARHLDGPVVLVCRTGMRALVGERAFADAGLADLHVLSGGMLRWQAEGGAVAQGRRRWDLDRQIRFAAGGVVLAAGIGSVAYPKLRWLVTAVGAGLVGDAVAPTSRLRAAFDGLPHNRDVAPLDLDAVVGRLAQDAGSR